MSSIGMSSPATWMVRLSLILGLAATAVAAQHEFGAGNDNAAVKATVKGAIVGPDGDPFNMPSDAAVGRNGNLYILDGVNHRVAVCDVEGQIQFQFGSRGSGLGQFAYPLGIAADPNGNIYVADSGNHRFQVFTAGGRPLEAVPLPAAASGIPPDPTDVAVDASRQRLYVVDNDNHSIHVYSLADHRFESVWGSPGQDQRQFRFPFLIDTSLDGYLFVVEPINTRVQVLNAEGKFVDFIGGWGSRPRPIPAGNALFAISAGYRPLTGARHERVRCRRSWNDRPAAETCASPVTTAPWSIRDSRSGRRVTTRRMPHRRPP